MNIFLICNLQVILIGLFGEVVCYVGFDICVVDGVIVVIGKFYVLFGEYVIDGGDCVVYLVWVNIYYYLFQLLLKGDLLGINVMFMFWLVVIFYCYCVKFDVGLFCLVVCIGMVELMCLGCGMIVDYNYLYYFGMLFDILEILFEEVEKLGLCFVLCWGIVICMWQLEVELFSVLCLEMFDVFLIDMQCLVRCFYDFVFVLMWCVVMVLIMLLYLVVLEEMCIIVDVVWVLGL